MTLITELRDSYVDKVALVLLTKVRYVDGGSVYNDNFQPE